MQTSTEGSTLSPMGLRCTKRSYHWLGLFLTAALTACAERGFDDAFSEYHERLSRTLSVDVVKAAPVKVTALPPARELTIDIKGSDIDVLDFLSLTGCQLQITIGKRNSSLGRLASASQRLLLELEYLQLAPACIDYLRS
ncbi:MAG: DUF3080 family protein, partial [Pseudomonadota bacterium]